VTDESMMAPETKKLLVVGGKGMLAREVMARAPSHYIVTPVDLPEVDITDRDRLLATVEDLRPDVIVNCAAYTRVDRAESEPDLAMAVNGTAVAHLVAAALSVDAVLVQISTDYIFDGRKRNPYVETDLPSPKSVYGKTKLSGEKAITDSSLRKYFIIRTSWLFGPHGANFVETILRLAAEREELKIIADQVGSPTYTADLADAIFALLEISANSQSLDDSPWGLYHFANDGQCSWYDFACAIVEGARHHSLPVTARDIVPIRTEDYPLPAPRPANSVFDKSKYRRVTGCEIPAWQDSLQRYFSVRKQG
jgi:dTDP-4-dehydrorhamnose reductase